MTSWQVRGASAGCLAAILLQAGCSASEISADGVPALSLQEVARYGNGGGEGAALSLVTGVALTDSTLLVLEGDPARIAVFGLDGAWHRDIGREGDGPVEQDALDVPYVLRMRVARAPL